MKISLPEFSLVVLVGATGSGKSTFAQAHFRATEILSSDFFRGLICDDETDQSVSADAFDALHHLAARRLARGRLTVIDATNVQDHARHRLLDLARHFDAPPIAIVLDLPEEVCRQRTEARTDRPGMPAHVVTRHLEELRHSLDSLPHEGFRQVIVLRTPEEVEAVTVERLPGQPRQRPPSRGQAADEREALVAHLRHPDPDIAARTLEEIRARGWLVDGTLQGAHLQGANLPGAWLARANLQHAGLMGADLRRANLYAAILRGADLYKADLAGASLDAAIFDPNTVLPDGSRWSPDASLSRFTDPPPASGEIR
jgi:predicted kinase